MKNVNEGIREQVKAIMASRNITQEQLAELMGIERVNLTRMLSGRSGSLPKNWQKLIDVMGLELKVSEK